jgi:DNA primase
MPGVNYSLIRGQIKIEAVLQLLQFEATDERGDQWRGPCPVHGSKNPRSRSFSVNVRLGRYHCFACGSYGHALELWAAARRLNLHAAAVELCQLLRIDVPWMRRW